MRLRRPLLWTALFGVPFVAVAVVLPLTGSSSRHFTAADAVLLAVFIVLVRLEYPVGAGAAVPAQLAFVPLLFEMPLREVPLAVGLGTLASSAVLALAGKRQTFCPNAFGAAWFTIPPVLILLAAGERPFAWSHWPVYLAAFAAQTAADLVPAVVFERVVNRAPLPTLSRVLATVYGFDALFTPVGMVAAAEGGYAFLAVLPLVAVLHLLSRERWSRLDAESEAERLGELAHFDELTHAANRRRFEERLGIEQSRAVRSGDELSVGVLDLDHFKAYNDAHGHPAGDDLLRRVAAAWSDVLRPDSLLARLGGEEFGLILPSATSPDAEVVVERLRSVTPREITFSAGIATWDGEEPLAATVERADAALYRAKAAGRDRQELTA
ncbi:MAG: diguanylate cyclase domain-containing protein [Gaiellaceae bacterium]